MARPLRIELNAQSRYQKFVEALLGIEYDSPLKATVASTVLGSVDFVRDISERHLGEKQSERNIPAVKLLARRPTLDRIIKTIKDDLCDSEELIRKVSIYCCQKYSGAKLKEIGEKFGISDAAVSQATRRLEIKAETDIELKKTLCRMGAKLGFVRS